MERGRGDSLSRWKTCRLKGHVSILLCLQAQKKGITITRPCRISSTD